MKKAVFHLPGLFEFTELYEIFLSLYKEHREYFNDMFEIGSIYGAPADCMWGGGRVGFGGDNADRLLEIMEKCGISARLTFSNSLLREEHLSDRKCNELCRKLARRCAVASEGTAAFGCVASDGSAVSADPAGATVPAGVIVHSDLLAEYLIKNYPELYLVSSTTKVITDIDELRKETDRKEFSYVVPDFRLNKKLACEGILSQKQKDKIEFLCNECCMFECTQRKACYESVSRKALGEDEPCGYQEKNRAPGITDINAASGSVPDFAPGTAEKNIPLRYEEHVCMSPDSEKGYTFSAAMKNPGFISVDDIRDVYLPMGYSNFKIEGRSLGSAVVFEMLLYYLVKPEYHLNMREAVYLDSSLDLF